MGEHVISLNFVANSKCYLLAKWLVGITGATDKNVKIRGQIATARRRRRGQDTTLWFTTCRAFCNSLGDTSVRCIAGHLDSRIIRTYMWAWDPIYTIITFLCKINR